MNRYPNQTNLSRSFVIVTSRPCAVDTACKNGARSERDKSSGSVAMTNRLSGSKVEFVLVFV